SMAIPPPRLLRADGTDASRTQDRMSPQQVKSRVANSDRKRSEGKHDIGYTRSGVGSGARSVGRAHGRTARHWRQAGRAEKRLSQIPSSQIATMVPGVASPLMVHPVA